MRNLIATKRKDFTGMFEASRYIQPYLFFYQQYKQIPNKLCVGSVNKELLYPKIIKKYNLSTKHIIVDKLFNKESIYELKSVLFILRKGLMIYFNPGYWGFDGVEILYSNSVHQDNIDELKDLILKNKQKDLTINKLSLLCIENNSLFLKPFIIGTGKANIHRNYNDDFIPIDRTIQLRLNKKYDKGIILLHGVPGTGKTTYIRHLISCVQKRMIYLPPEYAHDITSPDFVSFMLDYPNSVLIIEDAENIIAERVQKRNAAVSSLLNASDGLLSDCLNLQIICTFNTGISKIDPALMRKGRLIARYEFKPLNVRKASRLAHSLGYDIHVDSEMTLAEIYNFKESNYANSEKKPIGFKV